MENVRAHWPCLMQAEQIQVEHKKQNQLQPWSSGPHVFFFILSEKKPVTLNIYFLPLVTGSHFDLPVRGVVTTKGKQKCYWEKEKPEGLLSLLLSKLNWDSVILKVNTYLQWETFCYGSSGPSKKYLLSIEMSTRAPNSHFYFYFFFKQAHRHTHTTEPQLRCMAYSDFLLSLSWSELGTGDKTELNIILERALL